MVIFRAAIELPHRIAPPFHRIITHPHAANHFIALEMSNKMQNLFNIYKRSPVVYGLFNTAHTHTHIYTFTKHSYSHRHRHNLQPMHLCFSSPFYYIYIWMCRAWLLIIIVVAGQQRSVVLRWVVVGCLKHVIQPNG